MRTLIRLTARVLGWLTGKSVAIFVLEYESDDEANVILGGHRLSNHLFMGIERMMRQARRHGHME
jgi:hypothetical protein